MPTVTTLDVQCSQEYMAVQIGFDNPFNGVIYSKVLTDDIQIDSFTFFYYRGTLETLTVLISLLEEDRGKSLSKFTPKDAAHSTLNLQGKLLTWKMSSLFKMNLEFKK